MANARIAITLALLARSLETLAVSAARMDSTYKQANVSLLAVSDLTHLLESANPAHLDVRNALVTQSALPA